ncbi:hypothetical protein [Halobellus sp. Atlit-38R]|uniref:hypothetical protein n=1 Tax=Halobellus sp. Atlit-38R TaxID=2282131 RepID=UPI0011C43C3F|nr:hypothetical protein [Halobellus sp. Atlit-38R]
MILNLVRTILELSNYLEKIRYPRVRIFVYSIVSIVAGVLLSNSPRAADLPILTLTAILFGFTINAVVMLGNSSEQYLSGDTDHSGQLRDYYEKSLHISIHTLGVGIVTIIVAGVFQLFPDLNIYTAQTRLLGYGIKIELVAAAVYSLSVYYLIVFSIVIASAAELVKIRI